jgi:K+-sensing histidine kinase KdpD
VVPSGGVLATTGHLVAGVLAAESAGVWFDFYLTRAYGRLTITDCANLETVALLVAVGLALQSRSGTNPPKAL